MTYQFANNASSILTSGINGTDLTVNITPADAGKFPTPSGSLVFMATLRKTTGEMEVVQVTSNNGAGAMTITRAQEGTSPLSFIAGDYFELRLTKGALESFAQKDTLLQTGLNAQKVNGIEASTAKAANKLLACDADADLLVDIKGNSSTSNMAEDSSLLESQNLAYVLDRANHTGQNSLDITYTTGTDNLIAANNEEVTLTGSTYNKAKEIYCPIAGVFAVSFEFSRTANTGYATIYVNDVAVGTERASTSSGYVVAPNEDITIVAGDYIQLYIKNSGVAEDVSAKNFRLMATEPGIDFINTL